MIRRTSLQQMSSRLNWEMEMSSNSRPKWTVWAVKWLNRRPKYLDRQWTSGLCVVPAHQRGSRLLYYQRGVQQMCITLAKINKNFNVADEKGASRLVVLNKSTWCQANTLYNHLKTVHIICCMFDNRLLLAPAYDYLHSHDACDASIIIFSWGFWATAMPSSAGMTIAENPSNKLLLKLIIFFVMATKICNGVKIFFFC